MNPVALTIFLSQTLNTLKIVFLWGKTALSVYPSIKFPENSSLRKYLPVKLPRMHASVGLTGV